MVDIKNNIPNSHQFNINLSVANNAIQTIPQNILELYSKLPISSFLVANVLTCEIKT